MKRQMTYFLTALIIILLSTPLGYLSIHIFLNYIERSLSDEYVALLNGFIHSFMLIGILIFCIGLVNIVTSKKSK